MIYLEEGPSAVSILSGRDGQLSDPPMELIRDILRKLLQEVAQYLPLLRQKAVKIQNPRHLPWVAVQMVRAAKAICEEELTPMSAVAGAISEGLMDRLLVMGYDYISVNNGGDISLYSAYEREVKVGLYGLDGSLMGLLRLTGPLEMGIATSGLSGRSLTLGVAEMVTVISKKAAFADAAATYIANHTNVLSPKIIRKRAKDLDPNTDIPDELVSLNAAHLSEEECLIALENGRRCAQDLQDKNLILGCVIMVGKRVYSTIPKETKIFLEVENVNPKDSDLCGRGTWGWGKDPGETHKESRLCSGLQEPLCRCL